MGKAIIASSWPTGPGRGVTDVLRLSTSRHGNPALGIVSLPCGCVRGRCLAESGTPNSVRYKLIYNSQPVRTAALSISSVYYSALILTDKPDDVSTHVNVNSDHLVD